jgi:hypothetical protein
MDVPVTYQLDRAKRGVERAICGLRHHAPAVASNGWQNLGIGIFCTDCGIAFSADGSRPLSHAEETAAVVEVARRTTVKLDARARGRGVFSTERHDLARCLADTHRADIVFNCQCACHLPPEATFTPLP